MKYFQVVTISNGIFGGKLYFKELDLIASHYRCKIACRFLPAA